MATIEIDLEDIRTHDLLEEVCDRISGTSYKQLSIKDKNSLKLEFQDLATALYSLGDAIPMDSLEDKMKYEHLSKVWNKYSSTEIENLLP